MKYFYLPVRFCPFCGKLVSRQKSPEKICHGCLCFFKVVAKRKVGR